MSYLRLIFGLIFALGFGFILAQTATTEHTEYVVERDADIPDLPFIDNPNPLLCGIPEVWKDKKSSWISGVYESELLQPEVLLYDSHFRKSIVGRIKSGLEIEILLVQVNPELNYYLVRSIGLEPIQEGWVPEPFVSFTKP